MLIISISKMVGPKVLCWTSQEGRHALVQQMEHVMQGLSTAKNMLCRDCLLFSVHSQIQGRPLPIKFFKLFYRCRQHRIHCPILKTTGSDTTLVSKVECRCQKFSTFLERKYTHLLQIIQVLQVSVVNLDVSSIFFELKAV